MNTENVYPSIRSVDEIKQFVADANERIFATEINIKRGHLIRYFDKIVTEVIEKNNALGIYQHRVEIKNSQNIAKLFKHSLLPCHVITALISSILQEMMVEAFDVHVDNEKKNFSIVFSF